MVSLLVLAFLKAKFRVKVRMVVFLCNCNGKSEQMSEKKNNLVRGLSDRIPWRKEVQSCHLAVQNVVVRSL